MGEQGYRLPWLLSFQIPKHFVMFFFAIESRLASRNHIDRKPGIQLGTFSASALYRLRYSLERRYE